MKAHFSCLAVAALLVVGSACPGHAEDAAPAATQSAPPPSVPRPSLVPKPAEPAPASAAAEPAAPSHRHYAHRHVRRYGYYRAAYWEPFPIYWPHIDRNRIHWYRIPWVVNF